MDENLQPTFPSDEIICKNCELKKDGFLGYKNAYCSAYKNGKPNEILFDNASCKYFKVERVVADGS